MARFLFIALIALSSVSCSKWAHKVPSAAMEPTIKVGDTIWVDHQYYSIHSVARFDLVVYKASERGDPGGGDTKIVKRIIGLGGESAEMKSGKVFINDRELNQPFSVTPSQDDF